MTTIMGKADPGIVVIDPDNRQNDRRGIFLRGRFVCFVDTVDSGDHHKPIDIVARASTGKADRVHTRTQTHCDDNLAGIVAPTAG